MNQTYESLMEKKCVVPSTLFSIKKASLGNADMWKQATKIQQINPCYPFIHAGKF